MARDRGGSALTVVIAFAANFAVATAKTIAAVMTGSASMVAEAAHSWADTGNEVFLLVAERKSSRAPDTDRPLGYGREAYVWSMLAALGLVIAAGGMALHQVTGDGRYDALGSILVGLLLCVVAVVLFDRNRRFLTGEVADERIHQAVRERIEALPGVHRVGRLRLEFVGPRQILLVASIDLPGDESESHVAVRLRDLEEQLERIPQVVDAVLTPAMPDDR